MISALLLVAVLPFLYPLYLALRRLRKPRKRKPVVYLSRGPQRVLSAADLFRATRRLKQALDMGERP